MKVPQAFFNGLKASVKCSPHPSALFDLEGRILFANRLLITLLQMDGLDELSSQNIPGLIARFRDYVPAGELEAFDLRQGELMAQGMAGVDPLRDRQLFEIVGRALGLQMDSYLIYAESDDGDEAGSGDDHYLYQNAYDISQWVSGLV